MNPELRRHAWLDLGWHRLVIGPLVLVALAGIVLASSNRPAAMLSFGAAGLFLLLTVGWGSLRALASVTDEVRDRTWDFQRMAALTPAGLAMGKVFGAPIFQWYLGAWCLGVLAFAAPVARVPAVGSILVGLVAGAVLLHALGVAMSTLGARARVGERTRRATGLLLVLALLQTLPLALLHRSGPAEFVRWWNWRLPVEPFVAASLVLFAGWALLAAWRAMARELQEPARPWAWPAFAAFAALWWTGLSTPTQARPSPGAAFALASGVLALGTYAACALDPLTRISLGRTLRAWRPGAARWQLRVPPWLLHGSLSVAAGLVASVAAREPIAAFALPIALMAVRDTAVVGCFALMSSARAPIGRAVFYIALADLLVPALAMAMQLPQLARAAFPLWALVERPQQAAWGMALHALLACAALGLCIRSALQAEPRRAAP